MSWQKYVLYCMACIVMLHQSQEPETTEDGKDRFAKQIPKS